MVKNLGKVKNFILVENLEGSLKQKWMFKMAETVSNSLQIS